LKIAVIVGASHLLIGWYDFLIIIISNLVFVIISKKDHDQQEIMDDFNLPIQTERTQ
jgi:hypothetical protein